MRRPIHTLVLAACALVAGATAAAAATSALTVNLHESRRIPLPGAIANVVVGDPTVADVAVIDAHSVIVMGHGFGSTQLIVTDRAGHALLDSLVTVVSPDYGRVSVYRGGQNGATTTEFSCTGGRCHMLASAAETNGSTGGGGGGGMPVDAPAADPTTSASEALPKSVATHHP